MSESKTSQQETHDLLMAKVRRLRLLRIPMVLAMVLLGFHATRTALAHYRTYQNNSKAVAVLAGAAEQSAATVTADDRPSNDRPSIHETLKNGPFDSQPDTDAAERSGAATPAESPAVASPEWADAISGAVVWIASRALHPSSVRSESKVPDLPPAEEPSALDVPHDVGLISIVNPLSSGVEIHYMANDEVFHLGPGQTHELKNEEPVQLRFHRGGSFGDAIQLLTSGQYDFVTTEQGWDLVRRETRDVPRESH